MGRMVLLAFVTGSAWVQSLAALPGAQIWAAGGGVMALLAALAWRGRAGVLKPLAWIGLGLLAGLGSAWWQAQVRRDDALAPRHHNQVSQLRVRIVDLPQGDAQRQRLLVELADRPRPAGIPSRIQVSWQVWPGAAKALPHLAPGQVWRMALVLRQPHGAMNPHAQDQEGRWFAAGVRATATVRGTPRLLGAEPWFSPQTAIAHARFILREHMQQVLGPAPYAPVLIALAMGDQAGVPREHWQVFNRSGITHLVSISGMHVTMIAALGAVLLGWVWRRAAWRGVAWAQYVPAQVASAWAAFWIALLYCLLAGWGVPARRTFFMLGVVVGAVWLRLPLSGSRVLLLAAAAVSALDPWAILAPGFWLSFGAVAILLRVAEAGAARATRRPGWRAALRRNIAQFTRLQWAITAGLTPMLAFLLHQVSLGSPLANAIAIPVVGLLVTPLALLCAGLAMLPGAEPAARAAGWLGHFIFELAMAPIGWVGRADWAAVSVAAAPWPWLALAALGVAWALQPAGWPARGWGWCLALPLLCWRPERPAPGDWTLTALDVGQGGAIVIETASQVLLFDTGPGYGDAADAGARVVAPFLQALGYRRLDVLVVSHADLDHSGGLQGVLAAMPVELAYSSFDLSAWLQGAARRWPSGAVAPTVLPQRRRACRAGESWRIDDVSFRFLHPPGKAALQRASANADSCVLLVQGRHHAALLTGDIGAAQERALAPDLPPIDVLLAPHHGSATSSSVALVQAAQARHVIAQAGFLSRYRHPAPAVQARWQRAGASFWRSDWHGAVRAQSRGPQLHVQAQRWVDRRYWHWQP